MTKQATPRAAKTVAKAPSTPATPLQALAATLVAQPAAQPAKTVALRGGQAVTTVKLSGANYRTAAPHNQVWWNALCAALKDGPQAVAPLLATPANPQGVPAAFVGYAIRRGYLQSV